MDSNKGDDTTKNAQNDPKLPRSSSSSSKSSEDNFFQLNTNPNCNQPIKIPGKPPLSPQASLNTPKSDYDPNRIPADVFKSGTQGEWSVASNESLFSIHLGKSEDLSGYYNSPMDNSPVSPLLGHSDHLEAEPAGASLEEAKETSEKKAGKSVVFVLDGEGGKGRESTSGLSTDGSVASCQSFAFPILAGDQGRPSEASKSDTAKSECEQNKNQSQPLTPPLETHKEGSSDEKSETENKNPNNGGWFSCFSWLPASCRWGN